MIFCFVCFLRRVICWLAGVFLVESKVALNGYLRFVYFLGSRSSNVLLRVFCNLELCLTFSLRD